MKKILTAAFVLTLVISVYSQKIHKPEKEAVEPNEAQLLLIREGIRLHDAAEFDEAIKLYKRVLEESPDVVLALYEIAFSYYSKRDLDNSMLYALKAAEYDSEYLPRIYMMIANIADDKGESEKALEVYKIAIKQRPDDAVLRYNIGVTYLRMKNDKKGREQLKKSIELAYAYPSPHFLIADHFFDNGYRVPAMLAAVRFLALEAGTRRARRAAEILASSLNAGASRNKATGNIRITVNSDSPKDEGDFTTLELMLSMTRALGLGSDKKNSKAPGPEEEFLKSLNFFLSSVAAEKKNVKTFSGKTYFRFASELREREFVKILGNLVLLHIGSEKARSWLDGHTEDVARFRAWSKSFRPLK